MPAGRHTTPTPHFFLCRGQHGLTLSAGQSRHHRRKQLSVRVARRQQKLHPARVAHQDRADLQQFQPNRSASCERRILLRLHLLQELPCLQKLSRPAPLRARPRTVAGCGGSGSSNAEKTKLANEITKFPLNAAEACLLFTIIVTKPAPGVTSPMTGSPALFVPFATDAKTVSYQPPRPENW